MKHGRDYLLVFDGCEVFKYPNTDMYVIYGAPQVQDLGAQKRMQTAEQYKKPEPTSEAAEQETAPVKVSEEESEDVDIGDLDITDIETVMEQTKKSKAECVAALKKHNGDLVDSIMELS
ncbi:hypothetical protein GEMRC1_004099 [Eukaryota sp. GEM-RC1]